MRICDVEGCNEKHSAKGYCKKHYKSFHKYGDPLAVPVRKEYPKRKSRVPYESNHKSIDGIEYKKCGWECGEWYPMTREFFYINKSNGVDGFNTYCNKCTGKRSEEWRRKPENRDKWLEINKNKNKQPKYQQMMRAASKKQKEDGYYKNYQQENKDKTSRYGKDKRENRTHKINNNEWESCKNYFNYRCAYCELPIEDHYINFRGNIQLGDFHKEHVEDEGANDLSNCVPSCKSCNSQKWTMSFEEWYASSNPKYSIERRDKIIEWIEQDYKTYIETK